MVVARTAHERVVARTTAERDGTQREGGCVEHVVSADFIRQVRSRKVRVLDGRQGVFAIAGANQQSVGQNEIGIIGGKQRIDAVTAIERVIAVGGILRIMPFVSVEATLATSQLIVAGTTQNRVVAIESRQRIVAVTATHQIVAKPAPQNVVAGTANQFIVRVAAEEPVVTVATIQGHASQCERDRVHEVVTEPAGQAGMFDRDQRVGPQSGQLVIAQLEVDVSRRRHHVRAIATIQDVIAKTTRQRVVTGPTKEHRAAAAVDRKNVVAHSASDGRPFTRRDFNVRVASEGTGIDNKMFATLQNQMRRLDAIQRCDLGLIKQKLCV